VIKEIEGGEERLTSGFILMRMGKKGILDRINNIYIFI
jgi:hypothetical protein